VTTVLLVRHGLTALTATTLLGWTPDVPLDDVGRRQAESVAARLLPVPVMAVVSSPIERCRQTAEAIVAGRGATVSLELDDRLGDVRYGDWTGRTFKDLNHDPRWKRIHADPASFRFPSGEALHEMGARAVAAVRDWNERLGLEATYAVVSHADPIRAILVDALGLGFEGYLRLGVGPGSLSVIRYGPGGAVVVRVNDSGGDLADLVPQKGGSRRPRQPGSGRTSRPGQMS